MSTKFQTEMEENHYICTKRKKTHHFPPAAEINILSSRNQIHYRIACSCFESMYPDFLWIIS